MIAYSVTSFFYGDGEQQVCRELSHCADCDLSSSLWFCLTCGYLSCGRIIEEDKKLEFFQGGKGHAMAHFKKTSHPLVCKIKAINFDYADVYCYICEDSIKDTLLTEHLHHFGIEIDVLPKTEMSLEEIDEQAKIPLRTQIQSVPNYVLIPAPPKRKQHSKQQPQKLQQQQQPQQ